MQSSPLHLAREVEYEVRGRRQLGDLLLQPVEVGGEALHRVDDAAVGPPDAVGKTLVPPRPGEG